MLFYVKHMFYAIHILCPALVITFSTNQAILDVCKKRVRNYFPFATGRHVEDVENSDSLAAVAAGECLFHVGIYCGDCLPRTEWLSELTPDGTWDGTSAS